MVDGRVIAQLDEDWTPAGSPNKHFAAGSLVSLDLAQLKADPAHPKPTLIYAPGTARSAAGRQLVEERAARFDARQRPRPHLAVHARRERQVEPPGDGPAGQFDRFRREHEQQ